LTEAAPAPAYLTRTQERALALTIAVVTANAYCIHPIIGEVARTFGVGEAEIGLVPALNQMALGILLLGMSCAVVALAFHAERRWRKLAGAA
jgi:hypothetical protein